MAAQKDGTRLGLLGGPPFPLRAPSAIKEHGQKDTWISYRQVCGWISQYHSDENRDITMHNFLMNGRQGGAR
eukprot:scaffold35824_cov30-Phaeocystis_antarctica.AAC.1